MAFIYYDISKLVKKYPDEDFYIVFGQRSNGKTYSTIGYCLDKYARTGEQFVYLRRYDEDIRRKYMSELFAAHAANGAFKHLFANNPHEWNGSVVENSRIYLTKTIWDNGKRAIIKDDKPACYLFSLNTWEHSKGVSFPGVTTVIFDEFLTRNTYLYDEVTSFNNFVSTIVRQRGNVKFFLLGNTVSPFSPYFQEMGLTHVADMKPGTVQVYSSGDGKTRAVIEYCGTGLGHMESEKYFSLFDNEKSKMIVHGAWEMGEYPRFPVPYDELKVYKKFYIVCNGEAAQGTIAKAGENIVLYWTPHTKSLFDEYGRVKQIYRNAIIYTDMPYFGKYVRFALTKHGDDFTRAVIRLIRENRCYYASNRVGELVRTYLQWSDAYSPKK